MNRGRDGEEVSAATWLVELWRSGCRDSQVELIGWCELNRILNKFNMNYVHLPLFSSFSDFLAPLLVH